jgi:hypothetical protein
MRGMIRRDLSTEKHTPEQILAALGALKRYGNRITAYTAECEILGEHSKWGVQVKADNGLEVSAEGGTEEDAQLNVLCLLAKLNGNA